MKLRSLWSWTGVSLTALACGSGSPSTSDCCDLGSTPGVPSCVCGMHAGSVDAGSCGVTSVVGQSCTVDCNGMSAEGQTTAACSDQ